MRLYIVQDSDIPETALQVDSKELKTESLLTSYEKETNWLAALFCDFGVAFFSWKQYCIEAIDNIFIEILRTRNHQMIHLILDDAVL